MITKPTVFVLGAGASVEYGFPLGVNLMDQICKLARIRNENVLSCLPKSSREPSEISVIFADKLKKSANKSIDAFLEYQEELREIGKIMIAAALIPYENEDTLSSSGWYQLLFQKMRCPFDRFKDNQVKFITYNYDRSLEHFLTTAIANAYGKSPDESYKIVKSIDVVHLHGCLGNYAIGNYLSWDDRTYSNSVDVQSIRAAAKHIKIIHEDRHDNAQFKKAREILQWAEQIFFIGFGYDPINIARLEPHTWVKPAKMIRGTAYGMTGDEQIQALRALTKGLSASDVSNVLESHRQAYSGIRLGDINLKFSNDGVNATDFIGELPWSELGLV